MLLIPASFVDAEIVNFTQSEPGEGSPVYLFVQIIHRDSDGNLLGYLQSDKMDVIDSKTITWYVNTKPTHERVIDGNGAKYTIQVYGEKYTTTQDTKNITASTLFVVEYQDRETLEYVQELAARFAHDGLVLKPGDTVATIWNFAKLT
tara:strand:+ start:119 stop:562 length:444 start_codon:yes stop_codon:yes gene_type:complete